MEDSKNSPNTHKEPLVAPIRRNVLAVSKVVLKNLNSTTVAGSGINKVDSFELKAESESEAGMSFESLRLDSSSPSSEGSTNSVKRMVSQINALELERKNLKDGEPRMQDPKTSPLSKDDILSASFVYEDQDYNQPPQASMSFESLWRDSSSPSSEGSKNSVKRMVSQINALELERKNLKDGEPRMQDPKTSPLSKDDILSASFVYEVQDYSQPPQAGMSFNSLRRSTSIAEIEGRIEVLVKRTNETVISGAKLQLKKSYYKNALEQIVEDEKESPGGFRVRSSFGLLDLEKHDSRFTSIKNPSVAKRLFQESLENNYNSYSPNSLGDIKDNKSSSEQMRYKEQHPKKFLPNSRGAFSASRSSEERTKEIEGVRRLDKFSSSMSQQQDKSSGRYVLEVQEKDEQPIHSIDITERVNDDSLQKLKQAIRVFDKEIEKNKLEKLKLWAEIKELNEEKKEVRLENREINSKIKKRQENLVIDRRKESEDPSEGPAPEVPPRKLLKKRQENLVIDRRKESEDPSEGPAPKVPPRKLLSKNNEGSSLQ